MYSEQEFYTGTKWQESEDNDTVLTLDDLRGLIVWNDEVNTFDWVIESLIDVCEHSHEQAEQCAMLIHFKGKYTVKNGSFDTLRPQAEALLDRGIQATIDMS